MPGKSFVGKLLINIVFLIVFISPYLYGYHQYGESLFTPTYTPPRIDFKSNITGYRLEDSRLYVIIELDNMGEVNITVSTLNASIYSPDGDYITDLKLDKPVEIDAGKKENITFYTQLTSDTMVKLSKVLKAGGQLSIKGILGIDVYSSKVEYPLNMPISFPEDILSNYLNKFEISYVSSETSDNTIIVKVEVRNPLDMDFKIVDSSLKLYTVDGNYIGDVSTEKNVVIEAGASSYINLYIELTPDVIHRLLEYRSTEYKITGSITVESMNIRLPIQVNIGFELNISNLIGG